MYTQIWWYYINILIYFILFFKEIIGLTKKVHSIREVALIINDIIYTIIMFYTAYIFYPICVNIYYILTYYFYLWVY